MALRRFRPLRTLVALAVAAAGAVLPIATTTPPAHAASTFTLFDDTNYNDANLVANYGMTPAAVVYDGWNMSCANTTTYSCTLGPQADVQAKIKALAASVPATSPVVLDFEGLDFTSATPAAQAANDFQAWQTIIGWARAVLPAGQPLGHYAYDYNWNSTQIGYEQTLHGSGNFDFFAPSLYTHDSTGSTFTTQLGNAVTNDQAANSSQPIYPFIWPQWDISGQANTFMDSTTWTSQLNQLKAKTAGAIVWSPVTDLVWPGQNTDSCGWIAATHNFQTANTGSGGDTGTLGVTASFPNTCLLTRGQTTSVPVTVTNSGSTTSAATTLTVSGATGVSGTASPSSVPALAPGATWSTTVSMTVGANASLGDTIVNFALGGGNQYRTAIIEDPDLALTGTASQSSTNGSNSAALAIDGNTDPALADGSVAQTLGTDTNAWWQVDLGSSQNIGAVAAWASTASPSVSNYYVAISTSATPTMPSTPIPPNQWTQTDSGTWVMNVYRSSFRWYQYKDDTSARSITTPTVVPAGLTGRYVRVQRQGTGALSLAEVQVRPGAPDGPIRPDSERVANGGFENGSLSPWIGYGVSASVTTGAKLAGGYGLALGASTSSAEQTITVAPNTTYTLTGFEKVSASGNTVEIGVKNYGGSQLTASTSSTDWAQGTVTFTTGATTTSATVFCYHNTGTGTANCDDISVTAN